MSQRMLIPALLAVVGFCSPAPAKAGQAATQAPSVIAQPQTVAPNADDTRELFWTILRTYPRSVGEVLRRDPSLMLRADYMASYPQLAAFIAQHPEIPRNVEYYLEGYGSWGRQMDPEYEAMGVLLAGVAGFLAVSSIFGVLVWIIRAVIQHRRWVQASRVQADVHTKLMDRMTSNEELLSYIQSPAGRRFLEAAPLQPEPESPAFSAPVGSILWSMMAGIVFATVGAGFRVAAGTIGDEVQKAFTVVGVITFSLGVGFLLASLMAFLVSSRLGLFPQRRVPQSDSSHA